MSPYLNIFCVRLEKLYYTKNTITQSMRLTDGRTDRRTDGRTEISSLDRVCIPCSAVKKLYTFKNGPVFLAHPVCTIRQGPVGL